MLFGKIFYMIHRTISVRFLRDTIRCYGLVISGLPRRYAPRNDGEYFELPWCEVLCNDGRWQGGVAGGYPPDRRGGEQRSASQGKAFPSSILFL